ncbi:MULTISPECIES: CHASE2 domain-containing protein [unclassified Pseudoxanthomonas]|uniref:CHASE2 domain-containing protein n=1 Tax=unclassified Pseudoxanthomonas TaxID=2645906 RepID=UPI003078214F
MTTPSPVPKIKTRALITIAAAALVVLLVLSEITARADAWLYDSLVAGTVWHADDRIVLIDIDQRSLAELGRWPWSRRIHAQLIDHLREAEVKGVALNILLSEPVLFDPEGDALLARALSRSGKVVLPVLAEPGQLNAPAIELMPIPEFAASAAALGHAEMPLDDDGVARRMFLQAGMGSAHWPALALALLQLNTATGSNVTAKLPGLHYSEPEAASPQRWVRDHEVLIPYASSPNGFRHVSYTDVLNNRVPPSMLRDRWVIVGVSAVGMGSQAQVPGHPAYPGISGSDYQANVLNMLLNDAAITPLSTGWQVLLSLILVVAPLALCSLPGLQSIWRPTALMMAVTILISFLLLQFAHLWFPPVSALLVLAIGTLLWVYRRLRRTHKQAQSDPLTGLANRNRFGQVLEQEMRTTRRTGQPLSLLVLDIDHFKQLNDNQGHAAGDAVLRALAQILRSRARRPRDLVARLGGDEFAVLLPETSAQAAATIATTVHVDLANLATNAELGNGPPAFSISVGIHTHLNEEELSPDDLFERADNALYRAKQAGRNRSISHADEKPAFGGAPM